MTRPARFEDFRYLGDKRSQHAYDLDAAEDPPIAAKIEDLLASEQFTVFSPDTPAEVRNRGYRLDRSARSTDA